MAGTTRVVVRAGSASWDSDGRRREARTGDVVDVPSDVAARWIAQGHAERVPDPGPDPEPAPEPKVGPKPKSKSRGRVKGGASR